MNDPPLIRRSPLPLYLLLFIGLVAGVLLDRANLIPLPGFSKREPPGLGQTFAPFWETWNLVQDHYVDRESVKPVLMTQGAIEGMLASLGDVGHTTYLTAEELQRLEAGLKGQLEGIGARMTVRKHGPTILNTLPGSPARAAGLQAGDVLMEVDGKVVAGLPLERIVEQVRGPADTTVHLRILREGQPKPMEFDIKRAKVDVPDITWHLLPGVPVAHLAIQAFGDQADSQMKAAIEQARQQGAKGLILDVRGNPGGLKEQAVAVTSEFLKDGIVFIEQDAHGNRKEDAVREGGVATDIPVCVLIDRGTASSAEIFAGALQDHERAKLVGVRTFGTGTVLQPFHLSDGSAVLLAIAEWLTPKGRQIWHKGIAPDIEVALPEGGEGPKVLMPEDEGNLTAEALPKNEDKQLLKALEVLKADIHEP